jgi:hypothetical protein
VTNPWLTAADLAEIDVVAKALVNCIFEHKERCAACRETGHGCNAVVRAIEAAVDWAELRTMTSKATTLRAMQNGKAAA